jgi:hypothetical protein
MNAATAGGLLSSTVSARFVAAGKSNDAGQCVFTASTEPRARLQIEVAIVHSPRTDFGGYLQKCGSDAKVLKAIGNEAVVCTSGPVQRVVGRVRNQAFVISIEGAPRGDAAAKAAEIVAGNLF